MTTFAFLRNANAARQKEWDTDNRISLSWRGNEMAGELGEALEKAVSLILMSAASGRASNIIKKIERERLGIAGSRATKEQLADELADVVICADLIAMDEGIDLMGQAVPAKFNATSEKVGLSTRLIVAEPKRAVVVTEEMVNAFARAAEMGNGVFKSDDPATQRALDNSNRRITAGLQAVLAMAEKERQEP